jgi:hypothetical protein
MQRRSMTGFAGLSDVERFAAFGFDLDLVMEGIL